MFRKLLVFSLIAALMLSVIFLGLPMMMDQVMADNYNREIPFESAEADPQATRIPESMGVEEDVPALTEEAIGETMNTPMPQLTPVPQTQDPEGDSWFLVTPTPVQETLEESNLTRIPIHTLPPGRNEFTLDMIQQVNWRILLQEEKTDVLSQYQEAKERAEQDLKTDQFYMDQASYSTYINEMLLMENLEPQNLVSQKLRQGLLENLRLDPIYVPDEATLDQIVKQLAKLVDVRDIKVLDPSDSVVRETVLVKVAAAPEQRQGIVSIADIFRAKVVDVSKDSLIVEMTGSKTKLEAFINLMGDYEILELARAGVMGLERGSHGVKFL